MDRLDIIKEWVNFHPRTQWVGEVGKGRHQEDIPNTVATSMRAG